MPDENEVYAEGTRLARELTALRTQVQEINASDTQCKERVAALLEEARGKLREALRELAGLV